MNTFILLLTEIVQFTCAQNSLNVLLEIYEQKKCGLEEVQRIENKSKLHKV